MRLLKVTILLLSVIVICSCKNTHNEDSFFMPEFESRQFVETQILVSSLPCNQAYGIWESGELLCTMFYDPETETLVHLYDKKTGQNRGNFVHRGRGPLEIPPSIPIVYEWDGCMYMVDLSGGKILSFNIERLESEGVTAIGVQNKTFAEYTANVSVLPGGETLVLNNKGYLNTETDGYHRIEFFDAREQRVSVADVAPYSDPETLFYLYQQSIIGISPDYKHLVLGSVWGGLLEVYSLPGLKDPAFLRFVNPAVSINGGIELTAGTKGGLRDIVAKNNGFYAVIGTDVCLLENWDKPETERALTNNDIYLFSWHGKPLKRFETDYNIEKFCVTQPSDGLYSIVSDVNGTLSIGVIELK